MMNRSLCCKCFTLPIDSQVRRNIVNWTRLKVTRQYDLILLLFTSLDFGLGRKTCFTGDTDRLGVCDERKGDGVMAEDTGKEKKTIIRIVHVGRKGPLRFTRVGQTVK